MKVYIVVNDWVLDGCNVGSDYTVHDTLTKAKEEMEAEFSYAKESMNDVENIVIKKDAKSFSVYEKDNRGLNHIDARIIKQEVN